MTEQATLHNLEPFISQHNARTYFVFETIITIKTKAMTITETYYKLYFRKIRSNTQSCVYPLATTTTNIEHCSSA